MGRLTGAVKSREIQTDALPDKEAREMAGISSQPEKGKVMAISETELANLAAGLITAQAIAILALATTSDIGTKVMPALNIYAANGPPSLPSRIYT